MSRLRIQARTLATLVALQAALPLNLAVTAGALLLGSARPSERRDNLSHPSGPVERKTIMISGAKMTKALQLARSFHAAGHRVILIESAKYRLTGHRFSRAVDGFHVVPSPRSPDYAEALAQIVQREGVDVYVPVCSPVASYYDALAKPLLEQFCEVVHCDPEMIETLDDKDRFTSLASSLGLLVPEHHRITDAKQIETFDFTNSVAPYVLKSIPYDPVNRLDLTPLPRPSARETAQFAGSKPISVRTPWIMQQFVAGQEYCTHSTVRDGVVQLHCCCKSSAFQLNYEMVDKPEIAEWVADFVGPLGLTGQVSFDFIQAEDGRVFPIECNPRTHSAITMFYDHPGVAGAYLGAGGPTLTPTSTSRPTYWIYHELWGLLSRPTDARRRLLTVLRGKDAIFARDDPLPFLLVHHLQIPSLLLYNLRRGKDWIRIDFNIGKLVEVGGD